MQIEEVRYLIWDECIRLANATIELIIPKSFGIRILHFGFVGSHNEFVVFPHGSDVDHDQWKLYGGHRLWIAPESSESTKPDNDPVQIKELENGIRVTQMVDSASDLQKEVEVILHPEKPQVKVTHWIHNHGPSIHILAPWGITAFVPGGIGILPLPKPISEHNGFTAHSRIALWPYSDIGDDHFAFDDQFVLLRSPTEQQQKIGVPCLDGWGAYLHAGHLFIKLFHHDPTADYPDQGSSAELYCDHQLIEVESLGPLENIPISSALEHVETWILNDDVTMVEDLTSFRASVYPILQLSLRDRFQFELGAHQTSADRPIW
ncbi:MAG: hypothetical protein AMJ88_02300 [Anaerolineae bacterium SM23_ 63]|nr:MAG: hypothetical protein AMJ88_02300 [Anaerolineae bacterium SM23_ 63]HEY47379.1 hypothetical protein [Anaerolineae bacterium]